MIRRVLFIVLTVVAAGILLVAFWPQGFALQSAPIIAQVVALRGLDVAIALVLILVFVVLAVVWRYLRRLAIAFLVLLLVFCVASVTLLGVRGIGGHSDSGAAAAQANPRDITVLTWNTKGDAPGATRIAALALANDARVISLPATTLETGKQVALIMKAAGHPMWVLSDAYDYISKSRSTTLLVSASLGKYSVVAHTSRTAVSPTVVAMPDNGVGPTIIAVHAVSPRPQEMRNWRNDLKLLAKACVGGDTIMAGDFNSTLDHLESMSDDADNDFGECTDAGGASAGASVGSWPTALPPLLGAQIDHVMYGPGWNVSSMHVVTTEDASGSDHRPVIATLTPSS